MGGLGGGALTPEEPSRRVVTMGEISPLRLWMLTGPQSRQSVPRPAFPPARTSSHTPSNAATYPSVQSSTSRDRAPHALHCVPKSQTNSYVSSSTLYTDTDARPPSVQVSNSSEKSHVFEQSEKSRGSSGGGGALGRGCGVRCPEVQLRPEDGQVCPEQQGRADGGALPGDVQSYTTPYTTPYTTSNTTTDATADAEADAEADVSADASSEGDAEAEADADALTENALTEKYHLRAGGPNYDGFACRSFLDTVW